MIGAASLSLATAHVRAIAADEARMRFLKVSVGWIVIGWFVLSVLAATVGRTYRVGLDVADVRCMPWRVYVMKFERPAVARGAYVVYVDHAGLMGPKFANKMIGKQIVGVPGDKVVVRNDFAWVNGRPVGALIHNAKLGRGPGAFDREEVIPPGKVFVAGSEPTSYDSRYWGFLDQGDLIASIQPLL